MRYLVILCLLGTLGLDGAFAQSKTPKGKVEVAVEAPEVSGLGELKIGMTEEAFLTLPVSIGAKVEEKPSGFEKVYTLKYPEITSQDKNVIVKAQFFEGRLSYLLVPTASMEILQALTEKYGPPKVEGGMGSEKCVDRLGNIFSEPSGWVSYKWGRKVVAEYFQTRSSCGRSIRDMYKIWHEEMVAKSKKLEKEQELNKPKPPLNSVL